MKTILSPLQIFFFFFLSPFALIIFLKIGPPSYSIFGIFISFPLFRKGWVLEAMRIQLKIYEIIFFSFCVFPLEPFDFKKSLKNHLKNQKVLTETHKKRKTLFHRFLVEYALFLNPILF